MRSFAFVTVVVAMFAVSGCNDVSLPPDDPTPTTPTPIPPPPPPPPPPLPPPATFAGVVLTPELVPEAAVPLYWHTGGVVNRGHTDSAGRFSIPGVVPQLLVAATGYVSQAVRAADYPGGTLDLRVILQRPVPLPLGQSVQTTLFPDEPSQYGIDEGVFWDGGYDCAPCKVFNIQTPDQVTGSITIEWDGSVPLGAWVGNVYDGVAADVIVPSGTRRLDLPFTTRWGFPKLLVGVPLSGPRPSAPVVLTVSARIR